MSTDASNPFPNRALLAVHLKNPTAKRIIAKLDDVESVAGAQSVLQAAADARLAAVRKELERADAEVD